ncbi:MAG TPA: DUF1801 domain-containing protein [Candidatus Kapabacteria bacterium]|nr:DUF1801 domain-containing protein [Candidatus Kapabacteria bacterium]
MSQHNPKVEWFFDKPSEWQQGYAMLREIILSTGLTEELKWGCPCYTINGKNVVLMHGFNEYCALLFMKGALMQDPKGILVQQTENVQSSRQIRFASMKDILKVKTALKSYIEDAIAIEKAGKKVELKKPSEFPMAEEFRIKLDAMPELKTAFESLTPGRQRGYLLYFSSAKQSKTRDARVEKYLSHILAGKGIDD